jgi:hypothetical protein
VPLPAAVIGARIAVERARPAVLSGAIIIVSAALFTAAQAQLLDWSPFRWASHTAGGVTYERSAMLVPVTFPDASGTYWMQLDTGSDATMLYGIPLLQLYPNAPHESGHSPSVMLTGTIGSTPFTHFRFWIKGDFGDPLGAENPVPVIGTVGLDMLAGKVFLIDFPKKRFSLLESAGELPEEYRMHATFVAMRVENGKLFLHLDIGDTSSDNFFYDTGSSMFPLSTTKSFWQKLTGLSGSGPGSTVIKVQSWGKEAILLGAPARGDLRFGGLEVKGPTVYYDTTGIIDFAAWPFKTDGFLGNALFYDEYTVILDLVRHKFGIQKD